MCGGGGDKAKSKVFMFSMLIHQMHFAFVSPSRLMRVGYKKYFEIRLMIILNKKDFLLRLMVIFYKIPKAIVVLGLMIVIHFEDF